MSLTVLQMIPSFGSGGAEQAALDVAAALGARGDKAFIVTKGGWREHDAQKVGAMLIMRDVATKNPAMIIRNAFWLADFIRAKNIDVVHARSRAPAWSAKIACVMTGCAFVTTFHAAYKFSGSLKRAYNAVMTSADRVIAISPFIADHIRQNYDVPDARLRVIDRGIALDAFDCSVIDVARLAELRREWGLNADEKAILLPARLSPIKGHETALKALAILKSSGRTIPTTLFVGDDQGRAAYVKQLEDRIDALGLEGKVRLVGACADMPAAYALASLVLQPSRVPEGFGRVPVEAMEMGVPVIASALGGMKDTILQGQTGWLVDPDDADEWAQAMDRVLSMDEAQRIVMGNAARTHVAQHFSNERMTAQTLAVYDELMKEREA